MQLVNKINKLTLQKQIFYLLLLTIIIFLAVLISEFSLLTIQNRKASQNLVQETASNMKKIIISNSEKLIRTANYLSFQSHVVKFLIEKDAAVKYDYYDKNISSFKSLMLLNSDINDVLIYDISNSNIYGNKSSQSITILKTINLDSPNLQFNKELQNFVIAAPIYSDSKELKQSYILGYIILVADNSVLTNQAYEDNIASSLLLSITNLSGDLYYKSNTRKLESEVFKTIEMKEEIKELGLVLKVEYYYQNMVKFTSLSILIYGFLLIAIIFLVLIWIGEIKNIINPLQAFTKQITFLKDNPKKLQFHNIEIKGYPEIKTLELEFNQMSNEVSLLTNQLIDKNNEVYELQLLKTQAELNFLRSQINPHFLFNTFETIIGIAAEHKEIEIMQISKSLSSIFNFSLREDSFIPLHRELKMITDYLKIQKIRFTFRLSVLFQIDEQTLNWIIPKMILQPIVENAIIHGMEEISTNCKIICSANIIDDELEISVSNTGPQITTEKLTELQKLFDSPIPNQIDSSKNGIGLNNVNLRIKINYGNENKLRVTSNGNLTVFTIRIPNITPKGKVK